MTLSLVSNSGGVIVREVGESGGDGGSCQKINKNSEPAGSCVSEASVCMTGGAQIIFPLEPDAEEGR